MSVHCLLYSVYELVLLWFDFFYIKIGKFRIKTKKIVSSRKFGVFTLIKTRVKPDAKNINLCNSGKNILLLHKIKIYSLVVRNFFISES